MSQRSVDVYHRIAGRQSNSHACAVANVSERPAPDTYKGVGAHAYEMRLSKYGDNTIFGCKFRWIRAVTLIEQLGRACGYKG